MKNINKDRIRRYVSRVMSDIIGALSNEIERSTTSDPESIVDEIIYDQVEDQISIFEILDIHLNMKKWKRVKQKQHIQ